MPSAYRPADAEPRISRAWDIARPFHADPSRVLSGEAEPYCIFIPPPNVTAALHLGHALNNTLQDILIRAHRMMGFETLWMPGTDHAGIATQAVVEKRVWQEEKKRRHDFTREEFVAKIQAFKDEYERTITEQLKVMGCSCDWDRQRFTMDEQCAAAVREAFFRLFRDGLVYRGKRLVNWDPELKTAVADDETDEQEIDSAFYYMRYPLVHLGSAPLRGVSAALQRDAQPVTWGELARRGYAGADEHPPEQQAWVTVATTRPETYLGDAAVGMNPHDPRLKALDGLWVQLPLVGRILPIVADEYVVLPRAMARSEEEASDPKAEYATGFLKVTPAHDQNDYDLYFRRREQIDRNSTGTGLINVMAPDASISDRFGWSDVGDAKVFLGLSREEARRKVLAEFKARGLLEGIRPYRQTVKISDRSKAIIEPYLSDQWFVKVTDPRMAQTANAALVPEQRSTGGASGGPTAGTQCRPTRGPRRESGDGSMSFHPARYAKTYEQWHDNIRDWCISRQLWWGHRIPVWSRTFADWPSYRGAPGDQQDELSDLIEGLETDGLISYRLISPNHPGVDLRTATVSREVDLEQVRDLQVQVCVARQGTQGTYRGPVDIERRLEAAGFQRDPDVLDTWFSSALWPLSTLGWPDPAKFNAESNEGLLKAFNPSSVLCTAREIITLWVSRMVMFNRYLLAENTDAGSFTPGQVPFKNVFIHAVIQDGEGRKMSKSLGNGVDPRDIIESHGADAMRFTLAQMATNTQDVRLPVVKDPKTGRNTSPKFDAGRNFCNKLWNASRFALTILRRPLGALPPGTTPLRGESASRSDAPTQSPARSAGPPDALIDRWMLSRLHAGVRDVEAALGDYEFATYAQSLYDLLWRDFCDWYIEGIKPTVDSSPRQRAVLAHALQTIVRLLHPVTPFVTEAIWEHLREIQTDRIEGIELGAPRKSGLLCTAGWPRIADSLRDEAAERDFERLRSLITAIREVRSQHNVHDRRRITLHAPGASAAVLAMINAPSAAGLVPTLAGLEAVTDAPPPAAHVALRFEGHELFLSNLADAVDAATEKARLEKLVADLRRTIATLSGRLSNAGYMSKAPARLVEETRSQLDKAQDELRAALEHLERLA